MMVEYVGRIPPLVHTFRDDLSNRDVVWFGVAFKAPLSDEPVLLDDRLVLPQGVWYFAFTGGEQVLYSGNNPLPPDFLSKVVPQFMEAHRGNHRH